MTQTTGAPGTDPALLADLRTLIECESPSSDHDLVARSADVVARMGEALLGVAPERLVVDGVAHLRWAFGPSTRVLLVAHHDTVWPLGSLADHPFTVQDGILRGPGCFDMKTGLVMALHALARLEDRSGVVLLVTGDEELGSPASRALIESAAEGAQAALVLEASGDGGALKVARKGVSNYVLHVTGRAAHAGLEPHKGANAAVELAQQVLAIAGLGDADAGTTVVPTVLSAGTTTNTVPASGSVAVDVRAWSAAEQRRVDEAMHALTARVRGTRLTVTGGVNRPPLEESSASALFDRAQTVASRLGLPALTATAVGGASDGNFTAGVGVPTLDGLGAVGGGAHADDEHVVVSEIAPRTALLAALVADLLARPVAVEAALQDAS
jgi:glutamate carboxypeptidase